MFESRAERRALESSTVIEAVAVRENIEAIEGVITVRDPEVELPRFKTLAKMFNNKAWDAVEIDARTTLFRIGQEEPSKSSGSNLAAMIYRDATGAGCIVCYDADVEGVKDRLKAALPENTPHQFIKDLPVRRFTPSESVNGNNLA